MNPSLDLLSQLETIANIADALATVFAIIIGGIWSYLLFVRKRQKYPRAEIEHQVIGRAVGNDLTLLSIDVIISNVGDVLLSLLSWDITVKQMLPPKSELRRVLDRSQGSIEEGIHIIQWQVLVSRRERKERKRFEIEPGESEQLHYDFLIGSEASTISVKSYFQNVMKRGRDIGWAWTTTHDLECQQKTGGENEN